MVALTNREAQFAGVASTDPVIGWDKGIRTLAISAFTGSLDMQFTARNDWMAKVGISPKSSARRQAEGVEGRARRFVDHRRRTRTVHALSGAIGRSRSPTSDIKILAVGFGAARMAALRTNQVDITVGSAPEADQVELGGIRFAVSRLHQ